MEDFPSWLNAVAAALAALFSFLGWRNSSRTAAPEVVLLSAKMIVREGIEPHAEVRMSIRNLTEKTLYVRRISFARTRAPLEVAQSYEQSIRKPMEKPKDFRGVSVKEAVGMVARPSGSLQDYGTSGDNIWPIAHMRFPSRLPARIAAEITYSYGSPSGRCRRVKTNSVELDAEALNRTKAPAVPSTP